MYIKFIDGSIRERDYYSLPSFISKIKLELTVQPKLMFSVKPYSAFMYTTVATSKYW